MTDRVLAAAAPQTHSIDLAGIAMAAALGLGLLFVAGFSQAQAMHGVAHDQRHAIAFPCH